MARATLIIGLPGSGKSFLAKDLQAKSIDITVLIDDPVELDLSELDNVDDLIITDPHLCNKEIRYNAIIFLELLGYKVECIYFENDVEKCVKNIAYRNDGRIISAEGMKSFFYEIPEGVKTLKIWQSPSNN